MDRDFFDVVFLLGKSGVNFEKLPKIVYPARPACPVKFMLMRCEVYPVGPGDRTGAYFTGIGPGGRTGVQFRRTILSGALSKNG